MVLARPSPGCQVGWIAPSSAIPAASPYPSFPQLEGSWLELSEHAEIHHSVVGASHLGRPLHRLDFGNRQAPAVLMTSLVHGLEIIGGLGLLSVVQALLDQRSLLDRARFVVLPIVNPDGAAETLARHHSGRRGGRRTNARGVDLNRNFPIVTRQIFWHPLAGSRRSWSPYFMGTAPLSEPESQAVHEVVHEVRPGLAMSFHSFGNLVLYPWAHTHEPNPRAQDYERIADAFAHAQSRAYSHRPSRRLYPTLGDLDDWLDADLGALSLTIEVGELGRHLFHPTRAIDPFWWMNAWTVDGTLANLVPGVLAGLQAGLERLRTTSPCRAAAG